jgi:hypothetical protein
MYRLRSSGQSKAMINLKTVVVRPSAPPARALGQGSRQLPLERRYLLEMTKTTTISCEMAILQERSLRLVGLADLGP